MKIEMQDNRRDAPPSPSSPSPSPPPPPPPPPPMRQIREGVEIPNPPPPTRRDEHR